METNTSVAEKKGKSYLDNRKIMISRVINGILSTALMVLAINSVTDISQNGSGIITAVMLTVMSLSYLFNILFNVKPENKIWFITEIIFAGLFIALSISIFIFGITATLIAIYITMFLIYLILGRVKSIFIKRTVRNIVVNAVVIALIIGVLLLFLLDRESEQGVVAMVVGILIFFKSLLRIIVISFSQMKLKLLLKIVRKTFAAEIFFGLLLLVFAFSLVFQSMETTMSNYGDALWYSFAVVTTIGFGDITVVSHLSRVLSVILGMYGIVAVALITSIIVNFYNEVRGEKDEEKLLEKENKPALAKEEDRTEGK